MDIEIKVIAPAAEEFALPDPSPGDVIWADVMIQPVPQEDAQTVLEAFYVPESEAGEESVSLDIPVADLPADLRDRPLVERLDPLESRLGLGEGLQLPYSAVARLGHHSQ